MEDHEIASFPFTPYPQQISLMNALRTCIETSSSGCFESPTGTGKSLSSIYATCSWLVSEEKRRINEIKSEIEKKSINNDDTDWLLAMQQDSKTSETQKNEELLRKYNEMIHRVKTSNMQQNHSKSLNLNRKMKMSIKTSINHSSNETYSSLVDQMNPIDSEYLLHDYNSDDDNQKTNFSNDSDHEKNYSLLQLPQIIYCSRTHTQITQFIREIKQSKFHFLRVLTLGSRKNLCINENVKKLKYDSLITEKCLSYNKQSKSNKKKIKSTERILSSEKENDETVEQCSYHNRSYENELQYHLLSSIHDIEDIMNYGLNYQCCPYYLSRTAVSHAQIICLPYNMLLSNEIRQSLQLQLHRNQIILIDEAHNLHEAINSFYSCDIHSFMIQQVKLSYQYYYQRFHNQFNSKNLYYIQLLQSICDSIHLFLIRFYRKQIHEKKTDHVFNVNEFLFQCKLDDINFFKLIRYIESTNLIYRIGGFMDHRRQQQRQQDKNNNSNTASLSLSHPNDMKKRKYDSIISNTSVTLEYETDFLSQQDPAIHQQHVPYNIILQNYVKFLKCFCHSDGDGRIIVTYDDDTTSQNSAPFDNAVAVRSTPIENTSNSQSALIGSPSYRIRFLLLNPSVYFNELIQQTRSVILLGGTMQPFPHIVNQIFPSSFPSSKLITFSCDHIINTSQVQTFIIGSCPKGLKIELNHRNRAQNYVLDGLYEALAAVIPLIPHGMVIFVSSYNYLETILDYWKQRDYLKCIERMKRIFIEPKQSDRVDDIWRSYCRVVRRRESSSLLLAEDVHQSQGAILFCVMGGKLSEGINFSDELARCVIVFGLPFPDPRDVALQLKMQHVTSKSNNDHHHQSSISSSYYETICMKIVNQSIGRSIRHRYDYCSILLIDQRYHHHPIQSLLPQWIRRTIINHSTYPQLQSQLKQFYHTNSQTRNDS